MVVHPERPAVRQAGYEGFGNGGPPWAAIPDAFVSRLANSKAFWMYHHLHSSRLQRQGRKTSKQTKLLFANIAAQYSGHCSLTWLVPPWPGIAAEKRTKSLKPQSSVTNAGARLADRCSATSIQIASSKSPSSPTTRRGSSASRSHGRKQTGSTKRRLRST